MESLLVHLGAILSALVVVGLFGVALWFSRLRPYRHTFSRRDKVLLWVMAAVFFLLTAFWSVEQLD
jgi:hypothetical protein